MNGEKRRELIVNTLQNSQKAISASRLAKEFGVSRQIIVGDIALLRASGDDISATSKGYILGNPNKGLLKTIVCVHEEKDIRAELEAIIQLDAKVLDVSIEHAVYGQITANLRVEDQQDIEDFLAKREKPLSLLTNGVHSHQLLVRDEAHFQEVYMALDELEFIYKKQE